MGLMNAVDGMPMEMVGFMTGPLAKKLKVQVKAWSCRGLCFSCGSGGQ